jgi:hypothetical protein
MYVGQLKMILIQGMLSYEKIKKNPHIQPFQKY